MRLLLPHLDKERGAYGIKEVRFFHICFLKNFKTFSLGTQFPHIMPLYDAVRFITALTVHLQVGI